MNKKSLTSENLAKENIEAIAASSINLGMDSGCGLASKKVFRYGDPDNLRKHIKKAVEINGSKSVIHGIHELEKAAEGFEFDQTKPFATKNVGIEENVSLRKGQIIFGTVSIAHAKNLTGTALGFFSNILAPLFMVVKTGEPRKYAYLHAAVYAGKFEGKHYVIENGGGFPSLQNLGMISAKPLDMAFEKDARFFVVSPPLDGDGNSTRYLVLQRALACLGIFYYYHMRSVNCEAFAMTLLDLQPKFEPVQLETLATTKGFETSEEQKTADEDRFFKFHQTLVDRILMFQGNSILKLDDYLTNNAQETQRKLVSKNCYTPEKLNNATLPWWLQLPN